MKILEELSVIAVVAYSLGQVIAIVQPLGRKPREYPNGLSSTTETTQSGPYPPSGWAPSGDLLLLPGETHSSQQITYGPPPPPPNKYGPTSTSSTTTSTTTEANREPEAATEDVSQEYTINSENGQYYVYLGNGKLQKVRYAGKQKGRGQFEAQVQYEEVDPVRAPVYSYSGLPAQFPI